MTVCYSKTRFSKTLLIISTLLITLTFQPVSTTTATYNLGSSLPPNQLIQIVSDTLDAGRSVGSIGDTNNDGVNDMFIGSPNSDVKDRNGAGMVYILFGRKNERPVVDLDRWNNGQGYKILGANAGEGIGEIVKNAGDVNGDRFDDLLIGVSCADGPPPSTSNSGIIYVVYGGQNGYDDIDLANFDNTKGFRIIGVGERGRGDMISSAGDVNGDNIDDIIIRAYTSNGDRLNEERAAYVIYGRKDGNNDIDLNNFDRSRGFKISASDLGDKVDLSVSNAGDINKDGVDDILFGVPNAFVPGRGSSGIVFVIYGRRNGNNDINLDILSNNQGFKIFGADPQDDVGTSISRAGDVNQDGIDDIIIGAPDAEALGCNECGIAYVIYGRKNRGIDIDLANLVSDQGFRIIGAINGEKLGTLVSNIGDVNNDGVKDIMVGTDCPIGINPVMAYIVLGRKNGYSDIDLASSMNSQIIQVRGPNEGAKLGRSVEYLGDVNSDGISDIMIGTNQEIAYVIFGKDCAKNSECSSSLAPICYASKGCGCTDAGYNFQDSMCVAISVADASSDSKVGIIVGVTVGVAIIALISSGIILYKKKKRAEIIKKNNEKAAANAAIYQIEDKNTCIAPESNNNVVSFEEGIEYAPKFDIAALPGEPLSLANMADEQRACYEAQLKVSGSLTQSEKRNTANSSATTIK